METQIPHEGQLAMLEEYKSLRDETLKRIEHRYQIFTLTLVVAGGVLTAGASSSISHLALLLYPVLAALFAMAYYYNHRVLIQLGAYIREELEHRVSGLRWAHHFRGYQYRLKH